LSDLCVGWPCPPCASRTDRSATWKSGAQIPARTTKIWRPVRTSNRPEDGPLRVPNADRHLCRLAPLEPARR
jgi:hypothetical protein